MKMQVRVSDFVTALGVAVLLMVAGTLAPVHAALIESTFDNDLEHWDVKGGKCSWQKSDGNPGGYLQAIDTDTLVAVASKAFIGDLSKYDGGTLSFDVRLTGSAKPDSGFGTVTLWSEALGWEYKLDLASGDITEKWASYSASFDAKTWGLKSEDEWLKFISNISSITFNLETDARAGTSDSVDGALKTVDLDNFRLKSVPEPATVLLLGSALLLLGFGGRRMARWQ
jgi:hypothetical protein